MMESMFLNVTSVAKKETLHYGDSNERRYEVKATLQAPRKVELTVEVTRHEAARIAIGNAVEVIFPGLSP